MQQNDAIGAQHPRVPDVLGVMEFREHERQPWPDNLLRPYPAQAPARHEGVGKALRSAYFAHPGDVPMDMADLLAKLD